MTEKPKSKIKKSSKMIFDQKSTGETTTGTSPETAKYVVGMRGSASSALHLQHSASNNSFKIPLLQVKLIPTTITSVSSTNKGKKQ